MSSLASPRRAAVVIALALGLALAGPATAAEPPPTPESGSAGLGPRGDVDPRNWPTVTRLIADRYELAGQVFTLRAYARKSEYFNCGYAGSEARLMAFTLVAGPFETLTGYLPSELGKVLERLLQTAEAPQITVQVSFDRERLSDVCLDQVEILKWAPGWQYPPSSLAPERPDPSRLPSAASIQALAQPQLWKDLGDSETAPVGQQVQIAGGARLATAMHCAFRGAWRTHWALQLHDGRGRVLHAYLPKSDKARVLVDHLALFRDALLVVQARVAKVALSSYCPAQLEVVSWNLLDGP
jgi:hypothetical protein